MYSCRLGCKRTGVTDVQSVEGPSPPNVLASLAYNRFRLRVTVEDRLIQSHDDATTFASAICVIGCDKVAALGLVLNYHPLVSTEYQRLPHQRYAMQKIRCGDWIIVTHCSTVKKKELLHRIGVRLGISVLAENQ